MTENTLLELREKVDELDENQPDTEIYVARPIPSRWAPCELQNENVEHENDWTKMEPGHNMV